MKIISLSALVLISLVSFPVAALASSKPSVNTGVLTTGGRSSVRLSATASGDGITEYGFEVGTTVEYGKKVSGTESQSNTIGYYYDKKFGGYGGDSYFSWPQAFDLDSNGNVYVLDTDNNRIKKFDPDGNFLAQFGTNGSGDGEFSQPKDLVVDNEDNILVVDYGNIRIEKIDSDGNYISEFGNTGGLGQLSNISGIAVGVDGKVYVTDWNSHVMIYDADYNFDSKFGSWGTGNGQFQYEQGIAVDPDGNIYVVDSQTYGDETRVQKFSSNGTFLTKFGTTGSEDGQFSQPDGIAVGPDGNIYVADTYNGRIQVFDSDGSFITVFGTLGSNPGQFWYPRGVKFDLEGNLYVVDSNRVQKFKHYADQDTFILPVDRLRCETTYHFRAYAKNQSGIEYGDDSTFTTQTCAEGPTNISGTATGVTVNLNWDNPDVDSIYNQIIRYKKSNENTWKEKFGNSHNSSSGTANLSSLEPNTSYDFEVAVLVTDYEQTAFSEPATVITGPQTTYEVSTCEQFQSIGENPVTKDLGDLEGNYVLTQDIDCSQSAGWTWDTFNFGWTDLSISGFLPIMNIESEVDELAGFKGTLNGQGHTISNITQNTSFAGGIFGILSGATIENIVFDNLQINVASPGGYLGGLSSITSGDVVIDNVTINGEIKTASNNEPSQPSFHSVQGTAIAPDGNLYVVDSGASKIFKISPEGYELGSFGSRGSGAGQFESPKDIAIDENGNIYVFDSWNNKIQKFNSSGEYLLDFGSSGSDDDQFQNANGIAISNDGSLYVADTGNNQIKHFSSAGIFLDKFGNYGSEDGQVSGPYDVAVSQNGDINVADRYNNRIQVFNSSGDYQRQYGDYSTLREPEFITVDALGNIFVVSGDGNIVKLSSNLEKLDEIQGRSYSDEGFTYPMGIAVHSNGSIYVPDNYDSKLKVLDASGSLQSTIGSMYIDAIYVGGFVGTPGIMDESSGLVIENSKSDIEITIDDTRSQLQESAIGGFIGYGLGTVESSEFTGSINATGSQRVTLGGIAGMFLGNIHDVSSSGEISAENITLGVVAGGIAGYITELEDHGYLDVSKPTIERTYSSGNFSIGAAEDENGDFAVGGIAGLIYRGVLRDSFSSVTTSHEHDPVSNSVSPAGDGGFGKYPMQGLAAMVYSEEDDISNNYFDENVMGTDSCIGIMMSPITEEVVEVSDGICAGVNALGNDLSHFKGNNSVAPMTSWDFENIWKIVPGQYPQLRFGAIDQSSGDNSADDDSSDNGLSSGDVTSTLKSTKIPISKVLRFVSTNGESSADSSIDSGSLTEDLTQVLGSKRDRATEHANAKSPKSETFQTVVGGVAIFGSAGVGICWWVIPKRKSIWLLKLIR